jgi:hypothetical protein
MGGNSGKLLGELAGVRGPAMYGYEREGIPSSKLFGVEYAEEVFSKVKEVVELREAHQGVKFGTTIGIKSFRKKSKQRVGRR